MTLKIENSDEICPCNNIENNFMTDWFSVHGIQLKCIIKHENKYKVQIASMPIKYIKWA